MTSTPKTLLIALVISGMSSIAILGINIYKGQSSRIEQETEVQPTPVQLETNLKVIETFRVGPNTLHTVVYCPTGRTFILNNKGGTMIDLGVKTECNTGP